MRKPRDFCFSAAAMAREALTVPETMYQAMLDESRKIGTFGHGFTYSGHPVAAAVALKALEIYARDRIVEQAARKAPHFQARLAAESGRPLLYNAVAINDDKPNRHHRQNPCGSSTLTTPRRRRWESNRSSCCVRFEASSRSVMLYVKEVF